MVGAQQRGQRRRDPAQKGLRPGALPGSVALLLLDLLPPRPDLAGGVERRLARAPREDVGMPAHELVGDQLQRIGDLEVSRLGLELGEEHGLEDEVAQLLAERGVVVPIDRLDHLVRLLEHERLERVDRLIPVPRTPVRPAERRHDLDQPDELACRTVCHRNWVIG